jgi:hypothetical protein
MTNKITLNELKMTEDRTLFRRKLRKNREFFFD